MNRHFNYLPPGLLYAELLYPISFILFEINTAGGKQRLNTFLIYFELIVKLRLGESNDIQAILLFVRVTNLSLALERWKRESSG